MSYVTQSSSSIRQRFGRLFICIVPIAVYLLLTNAIAVLNERFYGWRVVNEIQSREYVGAFSSLIRLNVNKGATLVALPLIARNRGYVASPAFRELRPYLEGEIGQRWTASSCAQFHVCDGIAAGWFGFAFREAVAATGHYRTGTDAREYYSRLESEIDNSCDHSRIVCETKQSALIPLPTISQLPLVLARAMGGSITVFTSHDVDVSETPPVIFTQVSPETKRDFEIVHAQTLNVSNRIRIEGWIVATHGTVTIEIEIARGASLPFSIEYFDSPDLIAAFRKNVQDLAALGHARCELTTDCLFGCELIVVNNGQRSKAIDLLTAPSFQSKAWSFHVDNRELIDLRDAPLQSVKKRFAQAIADFYRYCMPIASVVGLLGLLVVASRPGALKSTESHECLAAMIAVFSSMIALRFVLSVLDVLVALGLDPEYLAPLYPLAIFEIFSSLLLTTVVLGNKGKHS